MPAQLAQRFEQHRAQLKAVAYRMLGSLADADEAVQETWLRASRSGDEGIENLAGWLTTIVANVCLNMLQARKARPEVHVPDPIIARETGNDPEQEVLLADSVGLALQVVLETLPPPERLAFVLHDMFGVAFDEIGPIVGRTATAARQLASRARRRIQGAAVPDPDLGRQREVVNAFFAAARRGDFDALLAVLDADVVLRSDGGPRRKGGSFVRYGAVEVAKTAMVAALPDAIVRPALVNGAAGVVVTIRGKPFAIMGFIVAQGRVLEIDAVFDPDRFEGLDLAVLDG